MKLEQQPYFHLSRNDGGKWFLMYKPEGDGRYKCWEPVDEEFVGEFNSLIRKGMTERQKNSILRNTSFKNVSGNWQFNGDMTPERFIRIIEEITHPERKKK